MVSSDDFSNADVRYEQSFLNIRAALTWSNGSPAEIPIVTGFLARGENTGRYFSSTFYMPTEAPCQRQHIQSLSPMLAWRVRRPSLELLSQEQPGMLA